MTFDRAVAPHVVAMRRYALALTRNSVDADDIVQDALERGFRYWSSYDEGGSLRGWLCKIVHSEFCRRYRRTTTDRVRSEPMLRESRSAGDMRLDVRRLEAAQQLETVLGVLAVEQRDVVLRCVVREQSYADTAAELGIPIGTVMSRLHRARRALKASLGAGVDSRAPEASKSMQADANRVDRVVRHRNELTLGR